VNQVHCAGVVVKVGSEGHAIKVRASSIVGAIGKATREFVNSLDRKHEMTKSKGVRSAVRSATLTSSSFRARVTQVIAAQRPETQGHKERGPGIDFMFEETIADKRW
jgi:hypothetical protein